MINEGQRIRDNQGVPIIDINYSSIKDKPEKSIEKIAEQCGLKIQNNNPFGTIKKLSSLKNKKSYTPEDFGIDKKEVYNRFDDYIMRYNILLEY